jgi:phosphoribosyl-ATP pyrophosphohydrolase
MEINDLDSIIADRLRNSEAFPNSSTVLLAGSGLAGIAEKVGEETAELIQAVGSEGDESVLNEAQQLLYMTAVGIALSDSQGGLATCFELAGRQVRLTSEDQNGVVKYLGRSATGFGFALGSGINIFESGAFLVCSVDLAVRFRQLKLDQVLERI